MTKGYVEVADLSVAPGARGLGSFVAAYDRDSSEIRVPTIVLNGAHEGPTLYLGALIHGDELVAIEVIRRIMREEVDPMQLHGAIIAVPIQNPLAYRSSTGHTLQDGLNANRIQPGDPELTISHRIVSATNEYCVEQSDAIIDIHSNFSDAHCFTFTRWDGTDVTRENLALARAFGITTVVAQEKARGEDFGAEDRLYGLLADHANATGRPGITPGLSTWDPQAIDAGVTGTLNALKHLKMLEGEIEAHAPGFPVIPHTLGPSLRATLDKGGIVYPMVKVGTLVEQGRTLALIRDPWGDVIEEVTSPATGYVLAFPYHGNHTVASGDDVAYVAPVANIGE